MYGKIYVIKIKLLKFDYFFYRKVFKNQNKSVSKNITPKNLEPKN